MLGGEIDNNDEATFGTGTSTGIDSVRADVAFIGCGGFAEDGGMTDYSITAAETRGKMILCGRAYLLADQTKFTRRTPFRTPNMDNCAGVIVDRMPDRQLAIGLDRHGLGDHRREVIQNRLVICDILLIYLAAGRIRDPARWPHSLFPTARARSSSAAA